MSIAQHLHEQWPLPLDTEIERIYHEEEFDQMYYPEMDTDLGNPVQVIFDCDWSDEKCPVCNFDLDRHNNRQLGRCASAAL